MTEPAPEPPGTSTYVASPFLQWDEPAGAMGHGIFRTTGDGEPVVLSTVTA